jgi:TorA maturation chaperone TorD
VEALLKRRETAISPTARQELDETLQQFWQRHPAQWVPAYGQRLVDNAQTGLYRFLGLLTEAIGHEEESYW